ncbi:MAG: hypothetical protein Q4Q06_04925 [Bacteroidota bacterium]|nr:hypothetical protein [Bacteroidota bacterium]
MKKILFYLLITLCLTSNIHAQEIEEEVYTEGYYGFDFGLYYMHFKGNNNIKTIDLEENTWNGLGIYMAREFWDKNKINLFIDLGLDVSWFKDIFMVDIPLALNLGCKFLEIPQRDISFMLHAGIGYFYSSMRVFDDKNIGGFDLYRDEHLEQHSAFVPFGIRFYYKHFFSDFTYRLRFAKNKVSIKEDVEDGMFYYSDYADLFYKRNLINSNYKIKNLDISNWCVTIGFRF